MSEQLERLASCKQITEWITPQDERLVRVTGLQPPVDAIDIREDFSVSQEGWLTEQSEVQDTLAVVKSLLVPKQIFDRVKPLFGWSGFNNGNILGTIGFEFEDPQDRHHCLPISDETLVFNRRGMRGNAAVALCGKVAGLAVISIEYRTGGSQFSVQPIRADKMAQIVAE